MITKSLLPAVDLATPEMEPSAQPSDLSLPASGNGNDFQSIISQTINSRYSPAPPLEGEYQDPPPPPEMLQSLGFFPNPGRTPGSNSATSDSQTAPGDASKTRRKPSRNPADDATINGPSQSAALPSPQAQPGASSETASSSLQPRKGASDSPPGPDKTPAVQSPTSPDRSSGSPTLKSAPADANANPVPSDSTTPKLSPGAPGLPTLDSLETAAKSLVPPVASTDSAPAVSQAALLQQPLPPADGIAAALDSQRMKFVAQKNELAGRAVQKLPTMPQNKDSSDNSSDKIDVKSNSSLGKEPGREFSALVPVFDLFPKSNGTGAGHIGLTDNPPAIDNPAAQVERVTRLVTQEVAMIKQSGANSLAVSLKIDPQTELFLQLTNHDGQIQASLRCERGTMAGLDSHWGQLQESLSRQNVQLLPLEEKFSSRASVVTSSPDNAPSRQFDQSAQNKSRQNRDLPGEFPLPEEAGPTVRSRNNKNVSSSPRGWETWA
jgi:hypothetical protein